jgi:hypothetical protein
MGAPSVIITWLLSTVIEPGFKMSGSTAILPVEARLVKINKRNKINKEKFYMKSGNISRRVF